MPKVEQIDWSKFKPTQPEHKANSLGTKQFSTHNYKEKRKNSKHGSIKTTKLPAEYRQSYHEQMNHLRSIKYEQ